MIFKALEIIILIIFYGIYLGKMILQKQKGIKTNQIAKGNKKGSLFLVEFIMEIATCSIIAVQIGSILFYSTALFFWGKVIGIILGFIGDGIFAAAVYTMKDSWRAGIAEDDKTSIITDGIYQYSRNPAFLGFDFMYLGILLVSFNWILLIFTIFSIIMLHLQIIQEEKFLEEKFQAEYKTYREKVNRYLGRRNRKG